MKLSVIIPVYRVEATLNRCVESVLAQTVADMEVILVDDGSPDRCTQLCDEWAARDHRISVIHKQNGGLSDARNAGIEVAKGDHITFVDSDDFIAPDTYAPLMAFAENADMVEFPVFWHYGAADQEIRDFGCTIYEDTTDYWLKGHAYDHAFAWNKIYKKKVFEHVRYPVGVVFEDVAVLPFILRHTRTIRTVKSGRYYYCLNTKGITSTASGRELSMLLDSHLRAMKDKLLLQDPRYYAHVLNIQIDVYEQTGELPKLPSAWHNPFASGIRTTDKIKLIIANAIGVNNLCKLNKAIHRIMKRCH